MQNRKDYSDFDLGFYTMVRTSFQLHNPNAFFVLNIILLLLLYFLYNPNLHPQIEAQVCTIVWPKENLKITKAFYKHWNQTDKSSSEDILVQEL